MSRKKQLQKIAVIAASAGVVLLMLLAGCYLAYVAGVATLRVMRREAIRQAKDPAAATGAKGEAEPGE